MLHRLCPVDQKIIFQNLRLLLVGCVVWLSTGSILAGNERNVEDVPVQFRNCGISCLTKVGQLTIEESYNALDYAVNPAVYSLFDLLMTADQLRMEPTALEMTPDDLKTLNGPAILHLSRKHFVVLLEMDEAEVRVYDNKKGEIAMTLSDLIKEWSGNVLVFEGTDRGRNLTVKEMKAVFGYDSSYHSSYPPGHPVYPDDRDDCDDERVRRNRCGDGAPVISVSPVDLNIKVEDRPLWYKGGRGPDIDIELIYKNEASQSDIGIGLGSTQFYPLGVNVFFNYASFYVSKPNDNIMVIMPDGKQLLYTYDAGNYIPPAKYYNTLEASGPGFVLTMKRSKTKYYYTDPNHSKLTAIEDKNGNIVSFYYDGNYNLDYIEDANNRMVQVTTNGNGRITQIQDPIGRTALFDYDGGGYLTKITDMAGFESFLTYDVVPAWNGAFVTTKKKVTAVQTPHIITEIDYEIPATIGSTIPLYLITLTNGNGDEMSFGWAPTFSDVTPVTAIATVSDFKGNITKYTVHMPTNRVEKIVYPDVVSSVFYEYDANGYRNKIIQGGYETSSVYDPKGNKLEEKDPRDFTTYFSYDADNNLISVTDPMNRTTTIGYDANHNITSITTPLNSQSFTYNAFGKLENITDANNHTTTLNYDGNGYLSTINYPSGNPETYINDLLGRPTTQTVNSITRTFEYDDLNQVTKINYPDNKYISNTYDFKNLIEFRNINGVINSYTYDCDNSCLLASNSSPHGEITYSRDANGNLLHLSINGQTTQYEYDSKDRIVKETNPDGTFRSFYYDEIDNVVQEIDENGLQTTYSYDYDLLTHTNYSDDTPDLEFVYNANGELTEMTDGMGTSTYQYDDIGRLTNTDGPFADDDVLYTYDDAGNITAVDMTGLTVNNTYDNLNRLVNVNSDYASATYVYDANSNLTKLTYGNGTYTDYTYDNLNNLGSITNKKSNSEILSGFNYLFGEDLNISSISGHDGTISSYVYDEKLQITQDKVINNEGKTLWNNEFEYDNLGNRTSISRNGISDHFTYNLNNRLTGMTKTMIRISGIVEGDSATKVYVENIKANTTYLGNNTVRFELADVPLGQLADSVKLYARVNDVLATVGDSAKFQSTALEMPDGTLNIRLYSDIQNVAPEFVNTIYLQKMDVQYVYDANGNLTQRTAGNETTLFEYDAENRLVRVDLPDGNYEEYKYNGFGERVQILKNGDVDKRFVYDKYLQACIIVDSDGNKTYLTRGLGKVGSIGSIINSFSSATSTSTYHIYNHRGDIISGIDDNEMIVFNTGYKAFGSQSQSVGQNPIDFTYSTKEENPNTGLAYFGQRYYMKESGRWLTQDPIRREGDINMYRYVLNNPVNVIDPDGEIGFFAVLAIGVVVVGAVVAANKLAETINRTVDQAQSAHAKRQTPGRGLNAAQESLRGAFCETSAVAIETAQSLPGHPAGGITPTSGADAVGTAATNALLELTDDDDCD